MPAFNLSAEDLNAMVAFMHSQMDKFAALGGGRRSVDAGGSGDRQRCGRPRVFPGRGRMLRLPLAPPAIWPGSASDIRDWRCCRRMLYPERPSGSFAGQSDFHAGFGPDDHDALGQRGRVLRYGSRSAGSAADVSKDRGEAEGRKSAVGPLHSIGKVHRCRHAQCLCLSGDVEVACALSPISLFLSCRPRRCVQAQSVDPKALLNPPADAWLTYHGEYTGQRHSKLTQITPENVGKLKQVWRFQTGQTQAIKASPILVDGVFYITLPDHIWAFDARTAKELWHYEHAKNNAFHIGHRGAAVYKDTVYLTTPDCHLIALERQRRQGQVGRGHRRFEQGLLVDQRPAGRSKSRDRRRGRRFRQPARNAAVLRCGHRQAAMDFLQHPSARRQRAEKRRRDRRPDVDDRYL